MSLMLATGVLKYRETENDPWQPLVLRASMDLNALADEFDSTKSYTRGDYVLKDNELYICKATAIQENTPWASSSWRKTSLAHELIRTQTVYYAEVVSYSGSTECLVTADIINPSNRSIDPMEMNSNGTLLVLSLGTIPSGSTGIFNLSLNITGLSSSWYVYKADGTTYNISEMNSNSTLLLVFQSNFTYGSNDTVTAKDVGWHMIGDLSASDKVSKAGDTMTGNLGISNASPGTVLKSTTMDVTASSYTQTNSTGFRLQDKNGNNVGFATDLYLSNGSTGLWLAGFKTINNSSVFNSLNLLVDKNGNRVVDVSDGAAWRTAINAVNKSGDTMSGILYIDANIIRRNNNLDVESNPSTVQYDDIHFYGKNSIVVGLVRAQQNTDGTILTTLGARRPISGNNIVNEVRLSVSPTGVKQVTVTDPDAWRTALETIKYANISGTDTTSGASDYAGSIKTILTSTAPQAWAKGSYAGTFQKSNSGVQSAWSGQYILNVTYSGSNYGTQGSVTAQGRIYNVWYQNGAWVVNPVNNDSGNNYCKMPDGTLIQWGVKSYSGTIAVNGTATDTVTFPVSFVNAGYSLVCNLMTSVPSQRTASLSTRSTTSATISLQNNYTSASDGATYSWIATGRWKS